MRLVLPVSTVACVLFAGCGEQRGTRPASPATPPPARLIAGDLSTCLALASGELRCLGATPGLPPLTPETLRDARARYATPHAAPVPDGTVELSLRNQEAACARDRVGGVACWRADVGAFVAIELPGPAVQVSAGDAHACAVDAGGGVSCWGRNMWGQTGAPVGDAPSAGAPDETTVVRVPDLADATYVVTGLSHSCALRRSGRVACWGANDGGQLGDGTYVARSIPRDVIELDDVVALSSRHLHTCALRRDGEAWCWGMGDSGQLGPPSGGGREGTSARPVRVPLGGLDAISAANVHTCGLRGGAVYCWGHHSVGQLGTGPVHTRSSSEGNPPARVPGLDHIRELAAGSGHHCALRASEDVVCWGNGIAGQTGGTGVTPTRALP